MRECDRVLVGWCCGDMIVLHGSPVLHPVAATFLMISVPNCCCCVTLLSFMLRRGGRSSGSIYSTLENAIGEAGSTKSPRRTWSSIAMNNKHFPDGKQLGYDTTFLPSSPSPPTCPSPSQSVGQSDMVQLIIIARLMCRLNETLIDDWTLRHHTIQI